jgi:hypothetical protein
MVLSGEGSDEVFGGYLYFHKAPNKVKTWGTEHFWYDVLGVPRGRLVSDSAFLRGGVSLLWLVVHPSVRCPQPNPRRFPQGFNPRLRP